MDTATGTPKRLSRFATMLIVVALVTPAAHVANADDTATHGPVYPWTQEWQEFTVNVDDTVLLGARWGACISGLAWSARSALSYDYSIDGEPVATEFVWDRPVAEPSVPALNQCIAGPNDGVLWWIYAEYPIVFDEPGTYELSVVVSSSRPLIDGADWDGDDKINHAPVGVFVGGTSTVHVLP